MAIKTLQNYRFKMGTFSYDSLNLLARYIKLPKLTTDSLSQIRLTVQAEYWLWSVSRLKLSSRSLDSVSPTVMTKTTY